MESFFVRGSEYPADFPPNHVFLSIPACRHCPILQPPPFFGEPVSSGAALRISQATQEQAPVASHPRVVPQNRGLDGSYLKLLEGSLHDSPTCHYLGLAPEEIQRLLDSQSGSRNQKNGPASYRRRYHFFHSAHQPGKSALDCPQNPGRTLPQCGNAAPSGYHTKYMVRKRPDPLRALTRKKFLNLHLPQIAAMDFFVIPRVGRDPLIGFFVIAHERRKLLHINVTSSPTEDWLKDQLMLALGTSANLKYLLSDNDQLYRPVRQFIGRILDLNSVTTQLASPWQNGVAERFVRTLREDLLNCIIPYSESVVRARLQEYLRYYNQDRTHSSIDLDSPDGREPPKSADLREIRSASRVGGLHRRYFLEDIA